MTGTWEHAKDSKGGGAQSQDMAQRQAHGTGRRNERRRLAGGGVGDVQVEGTFLRERRWGAVARESDYK